MKLNSKLVLSFLGLALITTACIDSPLINHVSAEEISVGQGELTAQVQTIFFKKLGLKGVVKWAAQPNVEDAAEFTLTLTSQDGSAVPHTLYTSLFVDMWMQMGARGHGSAPVDLRTDSQGDALDQYTITRMYFIMRGEWLVRFYLYGPTSAGKPLLDQAELKIKI